MSNVRTVTRRTKEEDAAALAEIENTAKSEGRKVVVKNGAKFIEEVNSAGMTIRTRIV